MRGGTAALEVETGRWRGVSREGRVCRNCRSEKVENVEHWLLRCTGMAEEREKLIMTMREKVEWQNMEDDERVTAVLSYACRDDGVAFFDRSLHMCDCSMQRGARNPETTVHTSVNFVHKCE